MIITCALDFRMHPGVVRGVRFQRLSGNAKHTSKGYNLNLHQQSKIRLSSRDERPISGL
jgi:hypothetical protein